MTDVLIVGGGLAGWRAAEAAANAGVSVTLVANGDGNSPHIHALNCPVRKDDSVERMIEDTMSSGHGTNDPALVRVLCEGAAKLKDEFAFDRDESGEYLAIQPLGSSVPRCVSIDHAIGAIALRQIKARLAGKVSVVEGRVTGIRILAQGEDALPTGASGSAQGEDALPTVGATQCGKGVPALAFEKEMWSGRPRPDTYPPSYFPCSDHAAFSAITQCRGEALPHWHLRGSIYHVVFRLYDSIPADVYAKWQEERTELKCRAAIAPLSSEDAKRLRWLESECTDHYLDTGHGECLLRNETVLNIVRLVLEYGNEHACYLHAVGLMPNHLHLILQLADGVALDKVIQGIKSTIAHRANMAIGRHGEFWQSDYYNHIIRTREEYDRQMAYVGVKNAGVFGWRLGCGLKFGWAVQGVQAVAQGEDALPTVGSGLAQGEDALPTGGATQCGKGVPALAFNVSVARASSPLLISSRAVVLATGGWCGKYDFSTNPPYLRGDGIALAESLGAATRDMDAVQYEPTVRVEGPRRGVPVITTLLYRGATLRNLKGEEFLKDKHANKDEMAKAILREIAAQGEDALPTGGSGSAQGEDALPTGGSCMAQGEDALPTVGAESCGKGVLALAQKTGVLYDLTRVSEADLRACKMDPAERRILVAPAAHTSLGGVVIDTHCRVLRADGSPIPGLFAAGEVTGGLHGRNRLGGNAGTEVMVFGKIAGESAANSAKDTLQ